MHFIATNWYVKFMQASVAIAMAMATTLVSANESGELLYNGIRLPVDWPPRYQSLEETRVVPCLDVKPKVVPIDIGRQLFVDDFLIESTTLTRSFHQARLHPTNPVLLPDKPWEMHDDSPTAMPFSDGIFYDPQSREFKMWYMGGLTTSTCYATSENGVDWVKPSLDVVEGTNIVDNTPRDSGSVWLDLAATSPAERYKLMFYALPYTNTKFVLKTSSDGIHWLPLGESSDFGKQDRHTIFYNSFRKKWVSSIRSKIDITRIRRYNEASSFLEAAHWDAEPVLWCGADEHDKRRMELTDTPDLYALDCVAYESLMIGFFCIWHGQTLDRTKPNDIAVGYSRDGFHWHRPDRNPLVTVSDNRGDWNWGNVQPAGGCFTIVGDELYIYFSARKGIPGTPKSGVSSTGLATIRRDGFVSMDAGPAAGELTTRPVEFSGKRLFVNVVAEQGELVAEILDDNGAPIGPFTFAKCLPVKTDSTCVEVRWQGADDLSALSRRPVQIRFRLTNGKLYSFWVSPSEHGASNGYVAAGGPGFTGPTDTVGRQTSADRGISVSESN